jgi:hypothetical protein
MRIDRCRNDHRILVLDISERIEKIEILSRVLQEAHNTLHKTHTQNPRKEEHHKENPICVQKHTADAPAQ